uniref:Uncharacterized protein n=1 Tax=Anguilla anguilla TaxID=7936 RepID=A0A0E9USW8_ANGAN
MVHFIHFVHVNLDYDCTHFLLITRTSAIIFFHPLTLSITRERGDQIILLFPFYRHIHLIVI